MRHDTRYEKLDTLDKYELENSSDDICGRPLVSPEGRKLGIITDLLVDREHNRVAAVRLDDGRTTAIEPLEIHDNAVVYGDTARTHAETGGAAVEEERIPVVEEQVAIGKRAADHGRTINVRTRVVGDTVREDVALRDETVSVERRPVQEPVSEREAAGMLKDSNVSMTEHDEEVVVGRKAVVTDEVVVKKTAQDRVERVEETARRTEVDVDESGDRGRTSDADRTRDAGRDRNRR